MENIIENELKKERVRNMKNPVIVMNEKDYEKFKNYIESKLINFKVGDNPKYKGITIKRSVLLYSNSIVIYDNIVDTLKF